MPFADAGPDQLITLVGATVQLDGSQSWDDDGDAITYQWSFDQFPGANAPVLSDATAEKSTFVADLNGDYILSLVVTDEFGLPSEASQVIISFDNIVPVAVAGGNRAIALKIGAI